MLGTLINVPSFGIREDSQMQLELHRDSMILRDVDTSSYQFKKMDGHFSLWSDTKYGGHYISYHAITVIGKDAYMPRFITPEVISGFFPGIQIDRNYLSTSPAKDIRMEMIHQPRNDMQKEALDFLTDVADDYECRARMLSLPTGGGKTFVTIAAIAQLKKRAMIFVDTLDLAKQWIEEIKNHSSLRDYEVMILSGQKSIEKAIKSDKVKIFVAMHQTMHTLMESSDDALTNLMKTLQIGIRVFDEAHVDFGNIVKINSISDVEYTFLLTATPGRSGYANDMLYKDIFGSIPLYDGTTQNRYHTAVICTFNSHPTDKMVLGCNITHGKDKDGDDENWFSGIKWASCITDPACYQYYEKALFGLIDKFGLITRNKKFFIMLPTLDLINKTAESIKNHYHITPNLFVGSVDPDERKKALSGRIVITDEKMLGKGLNVLDLDALVNFVQYGSTIMAKQIMGRLRNIEGHNHIFFDITDTGYTSCMRLQKSRLRFYRFNVKSIVYADTPLAG
jgi:hypothetical protein